ncbi:MAG TPA: glycosyltransferase family 2 protein [Paludibacter sp.]|nr:glycosyltransferase family 2 protein [Paludibacter sp.]
MAQLHIITPVKDSLETTKQVMDSVLQSEISTEFSYTIYNDFSNEINTRELKTAALEKNFSLVNLEEITEHPSPNYLLVLQMAQLAALKDNADLLIIESDVVVNKNTIQTLINLSETLSKPGLIAAVTTDKHGVINFPYLFARNFEKGVVNTRKRLSFCCTLITNQFLKTYSFTQLDPEKSWYDVHISHKATELGFSNYLITNLPVLHQPHSSRPWKQLKYVNPLKYYWNKMIHKRDKI